MHVQMFPIKVVPDGQSQTDPDDVSKQFDGEQSQERHKEPTQP